MGVYKYIKKWNIIWWNTMVESLYNENDCPICYRETNGLKLT